VICAQDIASQQQQERVTSLACLISEEAGRKGGVKGNEEKREKNRSGRNGKKEVFCFDLMGKFLGVYNSRQCTSIYGVLLDLSKAG
jgi:hypothetical protein